VLLLQIAKPALHAIVFRIRQPTLLPAFLVGLRPPVIVELAGLRQHIPQAIDLLLLGRHHFSFQLCAFRRKACRFRSSGMASSIAQLHPSL